MIHSFPPVCRPDAQTLILGSMPGEASLAAGQYYAHPRNAFWPIMSGILGFAPDAAYQQRIDALLSHRIALWDVLGSCVRKGSLDSAIDRNSIEINPFSDFLSEHAEIERILFNGSLASTLFQKHVLSTLKPTLTCHFKRLKLLKLPSTSPAHATMNHSAKLQIWREALS